MIPMPRPWVRPGIARPKRRCGFMRVAGFRNQTRSNSAALAA